MTKLIERNATLPTKTKYAENQPSVLNQVFQGELEGKRVQSCKRTNGFIAILNIQRLAENLYFSWLEGKVRDEVLKRTASKCTRTSGANDILTA